MTSESGELSPEAFEKLTSLEMELSDKLDGCCKVMRHFEAKSFVYKCESDRLALHAKIASNSAARLKEYMEAALKTLGVDKIETELFKLRLQKNPMSCQIADDVDVETLPDNFRSVTITPNKKAMIEAHKEGQLLPSGVTITQSRSLRIS